MNDGIECPLTISPCRHCSHEHMFRPYMKLDKDPRTGLFKPGGLGHLDIDLGHYCNNVGCWCDQLETCPIPLNLILQQDMIAHDTLLKEAERIKEEKKKAREKSVKKTKPKKKRVI